MGHSVRIGESKLNTSGKRAGDSVPAQFETAQHINTSVPEASDVVSLPNGQLAVVSDTKDTLFLIDEHGHETKVHLEGIHGLSEFEGVAYDPIKQKLFVAREESNDIVRYSWVPGKGEPKLEKVIDLDTKGPENKGLEGLAYLPEKFSPTGDPQLLAAKEGQPRQLLVFKDSGKGDPMKVELDQQVKDVLSDFSSMAIDPKSGNLFLSSDESSVIAQVRLVRDGNKLRARLIQAIPMENEDGKPLGRIEGITFNAKGDLFVLTENNGNIHELKRKK